MSVPPPEIVPKKQLPNLLSASRLLLGVGLFLLLPHRTITTTAISLGIILVSMITDYFDGRLARRTQTVSLVGKWLDPLSDFAFFLFVYLAFFRLQIMPLVLLLLFLTREVTMYAVIRLLYMLRGLDPGAKTAGKVKTVLQIGGSSLLVFLLLLAQLGLLARACLHSIALVVLSVLVGASLLSLIWYVLPLLGPRGRGSS
jgi:CDP-diacylglycerol--glycerol-3-phosphate 3-phosphatidyltransferase